MKITKDNFTEEYPKIKGINADLDKGYATVAKAAKLYGKNATATKLVDTWIDNANEIAKSVKKNESNPPKNNPPKNKKNEVKHKFDKGDIIQEIHDDEPHYIKVKSITKDGYKVEEHYVNDNGKEATDTYELLFEEEGDYKKLSKAPELVKKAPKADKQDKEPKAPKKDKKTKGKRTPEVDTSKARTDWHRILKKYVRMAGSSKELWRVYDFVKDIQGSCNAKLKRNTPFIDIIRNIEKDLVAEYQKANSDGKKTMAVTDAYVDDCKQAFKKAMRGMSNTFRDEVKSESLSGTDWMADCYVKKKARR